MIQILIIVCICLIILSLYLGYVIREKSILINSINIKNRLYMEENKRLMSINEEEKKSFDSDKLNLQKQFEELVDRAYEIKLDNENIINQVKTMIQISQKIHQNEGWMKNPDLKKLVIAADKLKNLTVIEKDAKEEKESTTN